MSVDPSHKPDWPSHPLPAGGVDHGAQRRGVHGSHQCRNRGNPSRQGIQDRQCAPGMGLQRVSDWLRHASRFPAACWRGGLVRAGCWPSVSPGGRFLLCLPRWCRRACSGALWLLIAIRFSLGAGEATMFPAANQFVERWFPIAERGKANGIIFAGVGLGAGLSPPLLTAIILAFGWRASFRFCATLGMWREWCGTLPRGIRPRSIRSSAPGNWSILWRAAAICRSRRWLDARSRRRRGAGFAAARRFWPSASAISRMAMWPGFSSAGFISTWRRCAG